MVKRGSTYYPSADEKGWKVVYFFLHYSMICIGASQSCLSWSFQTNNTIFTSNQCEKMPIQYPVLGFESTISLHKSSSITIRPGLLYYYSCSDLAKFRNFGKISQFWQNFKSLGKFCKGIVCAWQNFEPTLATIFNAIGQIFIVINGQRLL